MTVCLQGARTYLQGTHRCSRGLLCPQPAGGGIVGEALRVREPSVLEVAGRDLLQPRAAARQEGAASDDKAAIWGTGLQQADVAVWVPRCQHPHLPAPGWHQHQGDNTPRGMPGRTSA